MSKPKSRREVLELIKNVVGLDSNEGKIQRRIVFCPNCGDNITDRNDRPGQKHMVCPSSECKYEGSRAFIFDDKVVWRFNTGEYKDAPLSELIHFSVGTIIKRKERYLLFRRTLHPVGKYTIPAGHLEKGEDPKVAAIKEAYEETGLGILSIAKEQETILIQEPCRRSTEYHAWELYSCEAIGEAKMSYEADIIGWYTLDEIKQLPLTLPTSRFFETQLMQTLVRRPRLTSTGCGGCGYNQK